MARAVQPVSRRIGALEAHASMISTGIDTALFTGRGHVRMARLGARLRAEVDTLWQRWLWGEGVTVDDQATREIIERVLAGDGDAFATLFGEYERDLHRVCHRMLGDPQSAEDAVSEVFLRARRALAGFEQDRPFRPWLISIAGNYCIDQLRRRASEQRVFSGMEPTELELEAPGPSSLSRLMVAERRQAVGKAIEVLPLRYRVPLLLRYFNDLDYDAIAKSIGVTRNQVGTLLFRAKRLLRDELQAQAGQRPARRRQNGGRKT